MRLTINIETIPHSQQRYPTAGDYWWENPERLEIRVSKFLSPDHEFLVALHEIVESLVLQQRGIPDTAVTDFDAAYEEARNQGSITAPCGCAIQEEPGCDRHAPYYGEHRLASDLEWEVVAHLHLAWDIYNKAVSDLD